VEGATTRPTSGFTREMIFSTIYAYRDDYAHVLDLYAGCGSLGLEALSRGAEHITFVDASKNAVSTIIANITSLQVNDKCKVTMKKVDTFCKSMSIHKAAPLDMNTTETCYHNPLDNDIHPSVMTANLLHPEGMQRSVARQSSPNTFFASRRDATICKDKAIIDLENCYHRPPPYDLIFIDPPYEKNLVNATLTSLLENGLCSPDCLIVVEHSINEPLNDVYHNMLYKQKRVGHTLVSMLLPSS